MIEGQIIERFGWTFDELDGQDSVRTLQALAMMNLTSLYKDVLSAVQKHRTSALSTEHWAAYKLLTELGEEEDAG